MTPPTFWARKHLKPILSGIKQQYKIGIIAAVALVLVTLVSILFLPSSTDKSTFHTDTNGIEITGFTDDISSAFLSSDNLPDINNNRNLTPFRPLEIYYRWQSGPSGDALRPNLTPNDIAKNIKISPYIRGTWSAKWGMMLTFTPEQDWPANKKFTIKMNKSLFNPDASVSNRTITVKTPDITANIDSFNVYPDAAQPKSMIAVAVISFNYPIDTRDFADKVSLKLDGRKLDYTVKFDRFNRTAFITSSPISIKNSAQTLRLKLNRVSALHGDASTKKLTTRTTIESADNFFKIVSVSTTVADDVNDNAQQLILVNTTTPAARQTKWSDFIDAYLLPAQKTDAPDDASDNETHIWAADEITPDVLKQSEKLSIKQINFVNPSGVYQYAFSYNVNDRRDRYIYVSVKSGIKSTGEFILKNGLDKVMNVPYPNSTVKIAGTGALLSLAGDKKLGIVARGGVDTAYVNLYKVKTSEINHLISQTYDVFASNIEFKSWSFGIYDMSVVFQKKISFANTSMIHTNYASIDLGDYLDRTGTDNTGIFVIQTGTSKEQAEYNDKRLILLTDLGIVRKVNLDETSVVFVSNLSSGAPASDTEISVLGRNGNPIWAGRTDDDGRAEIPSFAVSEYKNAREPVAVVARRGDDVSFIPYKSAYEQRVEYSKFDIDGAYDSTTAPVTAYVFSDRGIYRTGETVIIGGIVKNKSFKSLSGLPIKLTISDARDRTVTDKTFSLSPDGMFDMKYTCPENAAIGEYNVTIYSLNAKNTPQDMLGTTSFQIAEFTPDTMKITAKIQNANDVGWVSLNNLETTVNLRSLFGMPATNRRITAHATLRPADFSFPEYKQYIFTPNFISGTGLSENTLTRTQTFSIDAPDVNTDDNGNATLNIDFGESVPDGTYILSLNIQGYENNSGKSVQTSISTRASNAKYLVGYHTNSDLSFINRNAEHSVNLIAIDANAARTRADGLTMRIIQRENLTSLIKDYNGYYKYQTVTRDKTISHSPITIPESGTDIRLDTSNGGTYFLQVIDSDNKILANIEYFVVGGDDSITNIDTKSELQIKLDRPTYNAGDTIAISVTAPYAGTGLITIERDKVYAYKWFTTTQTTSQQTITVPDGFSGTGYVNVSFVRDINSPDIFTTPYAYAVTPFETNHSAHEIDIKLGAPKKLDSNKLNIEYTSDQNAKMMIFAVNTGVLQVSKYKTPNPIGFFFRKSALQVETFQILSLLLPEYKILREFAKTGGSDYAETDGTLNQLISNPFARKTDATVAFYSGIIDVTANTTGTITFDIPEYFNGDITTFAVATNDTAMGSAHTNTAVQSPIIISAAAPVAVAPNDTFEINANISNLTASSGPDAIAQVSITATENLALSGTTFTDLSIPENTEQNLNFDVQAGTTLGTAEINIDARLRTPENPDLAQRRSVTTLSVRPITTFTTHMQSGEITRENHTTKNFALDMYPQYQTLKIYISQNNDVVTRPLFNYLRKYEFPCTEQIISRALPYAINPNNKALGITYSDAEKHITDTINILKNRQNDDGSFDLWAGNTPPRENESDAYTAYITAYVVQFLEIAKKSGFNVPHNMLSRGLDYLRTFAGQNITTPAQADAAAYAIYVITRSGYVTTGYISAFEEYANTNIRHWETKLMGAYIAASYKLLKQSDKATNLISKYKTSKTARFTYESMFRNNVANDANYAYLLMQHFDTKSSKIPASVTEYINSGNYSSYTSAVIILSMTSKKADTNQLFKNITVTGDNYKITGQTVSGTFIADIPTNTTKLTINCPNCSHDSTLYYTIEQQGFPRQTTPTENGLEILREYYDASGHRITSAKIGDTITAKIFVRTRGNTATVPNAVIVDLITGGLIIDTESLTGDAEFTEIREDRVIIYTDVTRNSRTFTYRAQVGNSGTFAIPPIHVESMYAPQVNATGRAGIFTVSNEMD